MIRNESYMVDLVFRLVEVIKQHSDSKPTLVFCSTRKQAVQAAQVIAKQYNFLENGNITLQGNSATLGRFIDKSLRGTNSNQSETANVET
jgi:replicative superfamily II helicase